MEIKKVELPEYLDNTRDWLFDFIVLDSLHIYWIFMDLKVDKISEVNGRNLHYFTTTKNKSYSKRIDHSIIFKGSRSYSKQRNGQFPRAISHSKYNKYLKKVEKKQI